MKNLISILLSSVVLLFVATATQAGCTCQQGITSSPYQVIDPLQSPIIKDQ